MSGFRELQVWQESKQFAVEILLLTNTEGFRSDFALRDQIRRSAVSVPSNIAEGDERNSDRDSIRFFRIAKGSLAELRTQLEIACDIGYMQRDQFQNLYLRCEAMANRLGALIQSRLRRLSP